MSRVGKKSISIPNGVNVSVAEGVLIFSNGKISRELDTYGRVLINYSNNTLSFSLKGDTRESRAYWGTYRSLANNIVLGLSTGFSKQLEINGVGYKASVKNNVLELNLGYSHPILYNIPEGIEISVDKNILVVKGVDKQRVGQVSAEIRSFRLPEPYKGKGIKYVDEVLIRKAGKTSKK